MACASSLLYEIFFSIWGSAACPAVSRVAFLVLFPFSGDGKVGGVLLFPFLGRLKLSFLSPAQVFARSFAVVVPVLLPCLFW